MNICRDNLPRSVLHYLDHPGCLLKGAPKAKTDKLFTEEQGSGQGKREKNEGGQVGHQCQQLVIGSNLTSNCQNIYPRDKRETVYIHPLVLCPHQAQVTPYTYQGYTYGWPMWECQAGSWGIDSVRESPEQEARDTVQP